jgi:hypothetical protein
VTSKTRLLPTTRMSPTSRTNASNFTILSPSYCQASPSRTNQRAPAFHCADLYRKTHRPKRTINQHSTDFTAILLFYR